MTNPENQNTNDANPVMPEEADWAQDKPWLQDDPEKDVKEKHSVQDKPYKESPTEPDAGDAIL
jgi:hypothetical protein